VEQFCSNECLRHARLPGQSDWHPTKSRESARGDYILLVRETCGAALGAARNHKDPIIAAAGRRDYFEGFKITERATNSHLIPVLSVFVSNDQEMGDALAP
jgi:hypothetical protein